MTIPVFARECESIHLVAISSKLKRNMLSCAGQECTAVGDERTRHACRGECACRPTHHKFIAAPVKANGLVCQGFAADLVLFDLNALNTLEDLPNEYREDVPGSQRRYVRPGRGFEKVWVNGVLAYSEADGGYVSAAEGAGQIV